MWNRFLCAAVVLLHIQPALGAESQPNANAQIQVVSWIPKPSAADLGKSAASLAASEWAAAYQVRGVFVGFDYDLE